ncbi:MAG TPA: adenylosuccinate synthetase [Patescibacteria group bacterium]|nr:adenylosuccinate synthetase [Patescibacteria group bacterium]
MKVGNILAVVGAQYGSEGKGVVVSRLAHQYSVHVRVGGANAGHSHIVQGHKVKNQIIPVGWVNPDATLVIGRGALVDLELLREELAEVSKFDPTVKDRLIIDAKAGILDQSHKDTEGGIHGEDHQRIGSTGEGVGAARIARIKRDPSKFKQFKDVTDEDMRPFLYENTHEFILEASDRGRNVLLEGTQGSGLSLIHGPWPYVTSNDTNAAQLCADVGIPPRRLSEVALVARTYPIRVAGNSGPLQGELSWTDISYKLGKQTVERTTVTKKIRRIGEWDDSLFYQAVLLNDPSWVALMFMDYLFPEVEGVSTWEGLSEQAKQYVIDFEAKWGVPLAMLGTGGDEWATVRLEQFAVSR